MVVAREVVVEHGPQRGVGVDADVVHGPVEAGHGPTVHVLVGTVAAVHADDLGLRPHPPE